MPVGDPSVGEHVGRKLDGHPIASQHPNTVSTQLAGKVGEYGAVQVELYAEQAAREFFNNGASDFNAIFFAHCPPRMAFLTLGILAKWLARSRGLKRVSIGEGSDNRSRAAEHPNGEW